MKGVYLIEHLSSGQKYIGSSYKIHSRWNTHAKLLMNNCHHNRQLQELYNTSSISSFKFSILEVLSSTDNVSQLREREQHWSLQFRDNINRLPLCEERERNFKHSKETIIKIMKSQKRYRPIYIIDVSGNIIKECDLIKEVSKFTGLGLSVISRCINKKTYHQIGYGFVYKDLYGTYDLAPFSSFKWSKKQRILKRKRTVLYVYDLYGNFISSFSSISECAKYFNVNSSNIFVKINKIKPKKILIDSEISKLLFTDNKDNMSEVIQHWSKVTSEVKNSKGDLKIYDCFGKYIGNSTIDELSLILGVKKSSIYSAISKDFYLKSLKITR